MCASLQVHGELYKGASLGRKCSPKLHQGDGTSYQGSDPSSSPISGPSEASGRKQACPRATVAHIPGHRPPVLKAETLVRRKLHNSRPAASDRGSGPNNTSAPNDRRDRHPKAAP